MNFLKNLFSNTSPKPEKRYYTFNVKCKRCGEIIEGRVTKLVSFGAFVQVGDGIEGLVHISEMAGHHVETRDSVVTPGEELWVKIIDIDLDRRRISLSLKQANESVSPDQVDFDPTLYGMAADYDEQGNYKYPEGFDADSGEWLEGFEAQRDEWERSYAEAQARFEAHRKQVEEALAAGARWLLLDNRSPAELRRLAARFRERAVLEANRLRVLKRLERGEQSLVFVNRRGFSPIRFDVFGYLPGEYKGTPTVARNAYRPDHIAVAEAKSLSVLPQGAKSDDEQQPRDRRPHRGRRHRRFRHRLRMVAELLREHRRQNHRAHRRSQPGWQRVEERPGCADRERSGAAQGVSFVGKGSVR